MPTVFTRETTSQTGRCTTRTYVVAESVEQPGTWLAYYTTSRTHHTKDLGRWPTSSLARAACDAAIRPPAVILPWQTEERE